MKVVKIVFGVLAGLYAAAQVVQLLVMLSRDGHASSLLGCVSGLCIGAAISVLLFRSAFKEKVEE